MYAIDAADSNTANHAVNYYPKDIKESHRIADQREFYQVGL